MDKTAQDELSLEGIPIPEHIAMIMDGNGRWAKQRNLPRVAGHRAGAENVREMVTACVDYGVKILTIYAFSTENWGRPPIEVRGLMKLFSRKIMQESEYLKQQGVRIYHLGELEGVDKGLAKQFNDLVELTKDNDRLTLNIAFNYGGRREILHAVRSMLEDGVSAEQLDEDLFSSYLFTKGLPDPDLIIRTSGELRLSNFLIWQAAYAELYPAPVYWPDFDRTELKKAIISFSNRNRRYGKV